MKISTTFLSKLNVKKLASKTFFDYSSREKKKMIKAAAKRANKMQLETVNKYKEVYFSALTN